MPLIDAMDKCMAWVKKRGCVFAELCCAVLNKETAELGCTPVYDNFRKHYKQCGSHTPLDLAEADNKINQQYDRSKYCQA